MGAIPRGMTENVMEDVMAAAARARARVAVASVAVDPVAVVAGEASVVMERSAYLIDDARGDPALRMHLGRAMSVGLGRNAERAAAMSILIVDAHHGAAVDHCGNHAVRGVTDCANQSL